MRIHAGFFSAVRMSLRAIRFRVRMIHARKPIYSVSQSVSLVSDGVCLDRGLHVRVMTEGQNNIHGFSAFLLFPTSS